jgi:hypothetical protein
MEAAVKAPAVATTSTVTFDHTGMMADPVNVRGQYT